MLLGYTLRGSFSVFRFFCQRAQCAPLPCFSTVFGMEVLSVRPLRGDKTVRKSFRLRRNSLRFMIPQTDKAVGKFPLPRRASPLLLEHGKCAANHHYDKWRGAMAAFPLPRHSSFEGRRMLSRDAEGDVGKAGFGALAGRKTWPCGGGAEGAEGNTYGFAVRKVWFRGAKGNVWRAGGSSVSGDCAVRGWRRVCREGAKRGNSEDG